MRDVEPQDDVAEAPLPRLHAVFVRGGVGFWCDTGLARPGSIAPAGSVTAVGKAGAPEEIIELLGAARPDSRIRVRVPVGGRLRDANVPGVRMSLAEAVPFARTAVAVPGDWQGASLRALSALSEAVAMFVRAGHVTPFVSEDDDQHSASWVLVRSPEVVEWTSAAASRGYGLVGDTSHLDQLVDGLADVHAKEALAALGPGRRSSFGTVLASGGQLQGADESLTDLAHDFARAIAAHSVECVLRVLEPAPESEPEESENDGVIRWRLEVLVRVGEQALRPYSQLPDPSTVEGTVSEILDRAARFWPRLREAVTVSGGVDLLVPTDTVLALVDEGVEVLRGAGVEVLLPRAWTRVTHGVRAKVGSGDAGAQPPPVDTGRGLSINQLGDVTWDLVVDGEPVDETELELLLREAGDLVRLRGRWVRADGPALRRAAKFLLARTGEKGTVAEYVSALASEEAEGLEVQAPTVWPVARSAGPVGLPFWFGATLRAYQNEGLEWLAQRAKAGAGAVLADDMGLGKTIQMLALESWERDEGRPGPTLVIAPLSLLSTWRGESERFARELSVHVHHGPNRLQRQVAQEAMRRADLVVTSYGTAARDAATLASVPWRRVIADEAQTIKNPSTQMAVALRSIPAEQRVALTGTPVENRLDELRAVLDFVNPGVLGSASSFRARFAVPIESHGDQAAASRLRAIAAPFLLRRTKSDPVVAADLPEKLHMRVESPLTTEQAVLYRAVVDEMLEAVAGTAGPQRKGAIFSGLTALKQVCNHPAHYLGDGSSLLRSGRHRSGKLEALQTVLDEIREAGESVLIFTQFRVFGDMILPMLERRSERDVPFLHGGVSAPERARMVADFQNYEGPAAMLASLKAGGTGLTLTRANHVLHLDRWWNPAVENQATDRVHRIGQTRRVEVRTFVAPGTVEDRIDELIEAKSELADLTIGPLAGALTALDDEALGALLQFDSDEVVDDG